METLLDLKQLGSRLAVVDETLVLLMKRRNELARQVGRYKEQKGEKMYRASIEDDRIAHIAEFARNQGVNSHLASAVLYMLIDESCKLQMIQFQEERHGNEPTTEEEWYAGLKQNLLTLTERWCDSYHLNYDSKYFATRSYRSFEQEVLAREIKRVGSRKLAIDLGCATGRMTFGLAEHFDWAIGYDLSPHMVKTASRLKAELDLEARTSFECVDLEQGIPLPDNSVSFALMNLGTASDVRNLKQVWSETQRVLTPGGRFLFSFYNAQALVYQWDLLPWGDTLAASVNLHRHCLEVDSQGEKVSIYARPYPLSEVEDLLKRGSRGVELLTYPTLSAVLPKELLDHQVEVQTAIAAIDRALAKESMGAYIVATGAKR